MKGHLSCVFALTACLMVIGCVVQPTNQTNKSPVASPLPSATALPSTSPAKAAIAGPLTLPVLDAFFADDSFSGSLKTRLQLTDEQVTRLKELARSETAKLNEESAGRRANENLPTRGW